MDAPNALWSADFKGQFKLGTGAYCYPLTIVDSYSRYLLACRGLESVATPSTRSVFEGIFRTYGLPDRIRTDNGAPFATCAPGRLSALSVWWIKLGITPELIQPAYPEQNGRHERMHRTLKVEATRPAAGTLRGQQRRFDHFQREYNDERPHEALAQVPPAQHYRPSPRPYARAVRAPESPRQLLVVDEHASPALLSAYRCFAGGPFWATAAFTSALNGPAATFSPSWMSIALRVPLSKPALKRPAGSSREAPFAKVSFTLSL